MRLDDTVLRERSAQENFPVASRALPRPVRSHLLAIYGVARVVDDMGDERAGDRLGELDAAKTSSTVRTGDATHPAFVRLTPTLRELDLDAHLPRADRGEPPGPGGDPLRHVGVVARLLRAVGQPGRAARAGVFGAATPERVGWSDDVCTALQVVEHLQDVGEDMPAAASTCPPRTSPLRRRRDDSARRGIGARCAWPCAYEVDARPAVCCDPAAPPLAPPPRAGARGGRRVRRRWPRRPRRDRAGRLRRARRRRCRPVRPRARCHRTAHVASPARGRGMRRRRRLRALRGDHPQAGEELRLRHPAAPARQARARCRRSTRWPGGSTTSATATAPPDEKLAELDGGACATAIAAPRHAADDDPVLRRARRRRRPLPDAAARRSTSSSTGCEHGRNGAAYKTFADLVAYCRRVAGSIGRLSLGVFGTARPGAAAALADELGVALQLTNILRDIARTAAMGRVYLPPRTSTRFGCDARR